MSNKLMKMAIAAVLAFAQGSVLAEDIDLFIGPPAGAPSNVLIILDNSSNWSAANQNWPTDSAPPVPCGSACNKQGYYELKAIRTVISGLPTDSSGNVAMNIGLMLFNNSTATRDGGYVRYHVRNMTAANRTALIAKLDEIISNFNTETAASSVQYGSALFDAFKYFGGYTNPASVTSNPSSPPAPLTNPTYQGISVFGTEFWGSNDADGTKPDTGAYADSENYNQITGIPCGRNFIILVGNGFPAKDDTASSNMGEVLAKLINPSSPAATIAEFPLIATGALPVSNAANRYADEFADFLRRTDVDGTQSAQQNVTTYAIDVYRDKPSSDQTAMLRNVAAYGGGKYFAATNEAALLSAFDDIFSEINSVNSAFASASLPVSVNTQGTYLNQVYIGMFRPEISPMWYGNLKQYQFRADVDANGNITGIALADMFNHDAVNSQNGFILPTASSFWTPTVADTYWALQPSGACVTTGCRESNSPDGEVVEKGAAAYKLRAIAPSARSVKTCSDAACSTGLVNFDTSAGPSATALGLPATATSTDRANLINWVRGQNVNNELNKGTSVMRPSVHGDVVHSRPLAIDFGGSTGVVVFYGGNDGMFRAIDGRKTDTAGNPASAGNELWSFMAPEHWAKLQRLKSNSPAILYPDTIYNPADPAPAPKDYFFDGSIGYYRNGSNVWIYPTMRRGGSYVYAFDVSTPTAPALKWKRGPAELSNVGQTWSEPKVVTVAGYPSAAATTKTPVIIMGGGYDTCEDDDAAPNTTCTAPKGNRIYVLDADTGAVLQTLGTGVGDGDAVSRSIAADVTAVDSDGDGYVDVAYAVDTGANVYRINIGSSTPGDATAPWTIKKIASLGCTGTASASCSRKFMYAPEVVVGTSFNAVLMGSGNREQPLVTNSATTVDNAFFMIKDDGTSTQALITIAALASINPDTGVATAPATTPDKGWYLALGYDSGCDSVTHIGCHDKEQVVTSAVVVAGAAYFSTHTPLVPTQCGASLGLARGYTVNYLTGGALYGGTLYNTFAGGGLAPSPVTAVVSLTPTNADGTAQTNANGTPVSVQVPVIIGGGGVSGIDPTLVNVNPSGVRGRVYWYIDQ